MAIFLDYIPDLLPYFWNSHHLRSPPLLAHRASLALAHLSTETFFDEEVKAVAKGIEADGVDNLAHEGKHQQQTGFLFGYAALAHIEEGVFVKLSYCGTVAALHIVSINLQLRLGVHAGFAGGT